jgi:hypothetical protein
MWSFIHWFIYRMKQITSSLNSLQSHSIVVVAFPFDKLLSKQNENKNSQFDQFTNYEKKLCMWHNLKIHLI